MRYWAVRLGEYVEIRAGRNRPSALTSRLVKKGYVLEQTFYKGGRVLGACTYYQFVTRVHLSVSKPREITREQRVAALKGAN